MSRPLRSHPAVRVAVVVGVLVLAFCLGLAWGWRQGDRSGPDLVLLDGTTSEEARAQVPDDLRRAAAILADRLEPGGGGVAFQVGQINRAPDLGPGDTSPAVEGGGATPQEGLPLVFSYANAGFGGARDDTFWQQLRADYAEGDLMTQDNGGVFLEWVDDGQTLWRNEGEGWFEARPEMEPGTGLDSNTLARLPALLAGLRGVEDLGIDEETGGHRFAGYADAADWPGIIAADLLRITSSPINVAVSLDEDGRPVRIVGQAINIAGGLFTETAIRLAFTDPGTIPVPEPLRVLPTAPPSPVASPAASSAPLPGTSPSPVASPSTGSIDKPLGPPVVYTPYEGDPPPTPKPTPKPTRPPNLVRSTPPPSMPPVPTMPPDGWPAVPPSADDFPPPPDPGDLMPVPSPTASVEDD